MKKRSANVSIIEIADHELCFSYGVLVAMRDIPNRVYVRTNKKWSKTTSKHINEFTRELSLPIIEVPQEDLNSFQIGHSENIQKAIIDKASRACS